jgi:hypothetical protein
LPKSARPLAIATVAVAKSQARQLPRKFRLTSVGRCGCEAAQRGRPPDDLDAKTGWAGMTNPVARRLILSHAASIGWGVCTCNPANRARPFGKLQQKQGPGPAVRAASMPAMPAKGASAPGRRKAAIRARVRRQRQGAVRAWARRRRQVAVKAPSSSHDWTVRSPVVS